MGQADDGAIGDALDLAQHVLDLTRIDVEAARDDEVRGAAREVQIAGLVEAPDIAGDEIAVRPERGGGLVRRPPIAGEDVGAAHLDDAGFALRQDGPVRRGDAQRDAGQRLSGRSRDPRPGERVRGHHHGLGHAVAFQDLVPGLAPERRPDVGRQRRGTRHEEPHRGRRRAEPRLGQQPRIVGRHAHEDRRARHASHDVGRLEARQEDHPHTGEERGVGGDEKPVGVKDRQRMQQHVRRRDAPPVHQRRRVRGEIAMGQHRALGLAGGAGGVEEGGEIVRPRPRRRRRRPPGDQRRKSAFGVDEAHLACDRRRAVGQRRGDRHRRRIDVGEQIGELRRRVVGVERRIDEAGEEAGEIERQQRLALGRDDGDAVAGLQPLVEQRAGQRQRIGMQRPEARRPPVGAFDRRAVRPARPACVDRGGEGGRRVGHRGSSG